LRLGITADAHLGPPGTSVWAFHTGNEMADITSIYRLALRRCAREGVDAVVLLGDLSASGDGESIEAAVRMAAGTGRRVWAVSGNHDCFERSDALDAAVRRVAAENVRLATPAGEAVGEGPRVAGISVASGDLGYRACSNGGQGTDWWGDEPAVWLTHYPMISFAEEVWGADLTYGDDLEDLDEVARPLLERPVPTVVVSGHVHLRHACMKGALLQVSCAALVEPPFEVTLLDLEIEPESGRLVARREAVPLLSSSAVRCPVLSPPQQEWIFEAGEWRTARTAKHRQEATQ
jgi:hypothetical protein